MLVVLSMFVNVSCVPVGVGAHAKSATAEADKYFLWAAVVVTICAYCLDGEA